jgi:hypothetical protein
MAPRISRHRLALRGSGVLFCRVKHAGTSPGEQDAGDVNGTNHDEPTTFCQVKSWMSSQVTGEPP